MKLNDTISREVKCAVAEVKIVQQQHTPSHCILIFRPHIEREPLGCDESTSKDLLHLCDWKDYWRHVVMSSRENSIFYSIDWVGVMYGNDVTALTPLVESVTDVILTYITTPINGAINNNLYSSVFKIEWFPRHWIYIPGLMVCTVL